MTSKKLLYFPVLLILVTLILCSAVSEASYLDVSRNVRVGLTILGRPQAFSIEPSTGYIEIFDGSRNHSIYSGKAARIQLNLLKDGKTRLTVDERKTLYFNDKELLFSAVGRVPINLKIRGGNGKSFSYRGTLAIAPERGGLFAVNIVDMEDYLKSVVPCEISVKAPDAAQEAQTIAARTYAVRHIDRHGKDQRYQVCDTVHCQVYTGILRETQLASKAVKKTEGQILSFAKAPANTVYHSNCGGYLISSKAAWSGSEIPYLVSHFDGPPGEDPFCSYGNRYRQNKPTGKFPKPDPQLKVKPLPWNARKLVSKNYGHRVGMCQDGAIGMALAGYSARQILAFYYPGTRLESLGYAGPGIQVPPEPDQKPIIVAATPEAVTVVAPPPEKNLLPLEGPINPTQISALMRKNTPSEARKKNILTTLKEISTVRAGNTALGVRKVFWTPADPGISRNRRIF